MSFQVIEIIDEEKIRVAPRWKWSTGASDIVQVNGLSLASGEDADLQKTKLNKLLLNKTVELNNPLRIIQEQLLCDVFLDGNHVNKELLKHQP